MTGVWHTWHDIWYFLAKAGMALIFSAVNPITRIAAMAPFIIIARFII